MIIHKTHKDFIVYLYMHIAYADGEFHAMERHMIHKKISALFPYHNNHYHLIDLQEEAYLAFAPELVKDIITKSFTHFKELNFSLRYKIYMDLHDIVYADGKVLESEIRAVNELRRIINLSIEPLSDFNRRPRL
jgi:uncharacterized tellurite resistance protein B-like protein